MRISAAETPYIENNAADNSVRSRDGAVGIASATGWTAEGVRVRIPLRYTFSLLYVVQIGCGVHPASYPMDTGDFSPGGKAADS
jgi:hypothetical protein